MTVTYSPRAYYLLTRWKGSVWKSVWKPLLIWLLLYYIIYFVLKFALSSDQQKTASKVVELFNTFCKDLPIVFILGFYVGQVVTRWWNMVLAIPWPEEIVAIANSCMYDGDHLKAIRETVARWLVLSEAMVFRQLSSRVFKRFPKLEHMIDAGLMTDQEFSMIVGAKCDNVRWEMPLDWIINKVVFPSDAPPNFKIAFISQINVFRQKLQQLFMYDWVTIPLVYTQTVAVVVYGYFAFALIGHQYVGKSIDLYFPWLSVLQFIFFVGWLNVARDLMHPWGEDDDEIELHWILDRHAAVAFTVATDVREQVPDIVFDDVKRRNMGMKMVNSMSYTVAAAQVKNHPPKMRSYMKLDPSDLEQVRHSALAKDAKSDTILDKISKVRKPFSYF